MRNLPDATIGLGTHQEYVTGSGCLIEKSIYYLVNFISFPRGQGEVVRKTVSHMSNGHTHTHRVLTTHLIALKILSPQ